MLEQWHSSQGGHPAVRRLSADKRNTCSHGALALPGLQRGSRLVKTTRGYGQVVSQRSMIKDGRETVDSTMHNE